MMKRQPAAMAATLLAAWVAVVLAGSSVLYRQALERLRAELEGAADIAAGLVSQRLAQHDAHLTSLAALAQRSDRILVDEIGQVAGAIRSFYPRIEGVDLVAWEGDPPEPAGWRTLVSSHRAGLEPVALPQLAPVLASAQPGRPVSSVPRPGRSRYVLVKRLPSAVGRFALVLTIDLAELVAGEELPAWGQLELRLGPASARVGHGGAAARAERFGPPAMTAERMLDNAGQPISLRLVRQPGWSDLALLRPVALLAAVALVPLGLAVLLAVQRRRAAQARGEAERARQATRLSERETAQAHAARVNAMGEMASGIAHELNQPLTALLSQSQAAVRLAGMPATDPAVMRRVLEANVQQARRAADILDRMRAYVSARPPAAGVCELGRIAMDMAELMRADLSAREIRLELDISTPPPLAWADPVQVGQVMHNLIRNAADALAGSGQENRHIVLRVDEADDMARIVVSDNGPGVAADMLPHVFEPFRSDKPDGMGLGLAICESIVHRFDGRIEAANPSGGGAAFTVLLPLARRKEHAS